MPQFLWPDFYDVMPFPRPWTSPVLSIYGEPTVCLYKDVETAWGGPLPSNEGVATKILFNYSQATMYETFDPATGKTVTIEERLRCGLTQRANGEWAFDKPPVA